jgi:predicted anti-sigma-YlaC factor YlaD
MNRSAHEQARELIALAGAQDLSGEQQHWLQNHLGQCASCVGFAEAVGRVVSALHSQPQAADFALVQTTQRRVRLRAVELRQQQERIWLTCLACTFVGLSSAFTTPLFWRACEWIGQRAGIANWVWQAGFGFFWMVPALVVSALLLAHGTHLTNDGKYEL